MEEETEYETQEFEQPQKKKFNKKFFLILGISILALTLVSAIIYLAYHSEFTKTINIFRNGGEQQVSITGAGDMTNGVLSCDNTNSLCVLTTGNITLRNDDIAEHTCNVVTNGSENINVSYLGDTTNGTIVLVSGETKVFQIQYSSNTVGSFPMKTTIDC